MGRKKIFVNETPEQKKARLSANRQRNREIERAAEQGKFSIIERWNASLRALKCGQPAEYQRLIEQEELLDGLTGEAQLALDTLGRPPGTSVLVEDVELEVPDPCRAYLELKAYADQHGIQSYLPPEAFDPYKEESPVEFEQYTKRYPIYAQFGVRECVEHDILKKLAHAILSYHIQNPDSGFDPLLLGGLIKDFVAETWQYFKSFEKLYVAMSSPTCLIGRRILSLAGIRPFVEPTLGCGLASMFVRPVCGDEVTSEYQLARTTYDGLTENARAETRKEMIAAAEKLWKDSGLGVARKVA